jgi:hypothetical protein
MQMQILANNFIFSEFTICYELTTFATLSAVSADCWPDVWNSSAQDVDVVSAR